MRHSIKAALAVSASALVFSGDIASAEITGPITFFTHFGTFQTNGRWDDWTAEFEALYPGTDVEVIVVDGYRREMPTRLASGDYGDVLNVLDNLPPDQYAEFYLPLNDMELRDTHMFVDRYTVDGNVYGYIYGANAEAVVYNRSAFERAGIESVPTTRTELFAACEALNEAGITPFQINMGAGWPMQQWDKAALLFAGDGGYYEDALASATPFSPDEPYGESISFVHDLFEAGCTERDYTANNWDQSKAMLGVGEAGMWFLANWSVPQAIASGEALGMENVSDDLGMFPLPIDDSGSPAVLLNPDWAIGVSANSDNPETAMAWVEFLLTQTDVANEAGFIPGDTRIEPTLPQLVELLAPEPPIIESETPSSAFKQAMADARLDFMAGTYIRDLVLADDFAAAIADVNARWDRANGN
ncbi:carbohydrate ABC transporter substrate-binding protein [Rhodophyticola sp. CCM32]|uniref:ABC transporter substrate-binding protein n=1 Tax=Rhodophyticola sp. CCM32 TaxID=2916397 RepID=UPI00107F3FDF|nr:ABC transporter substrate-binding protein [Rhodophyticola sp. CCM32]QBY01360.1 carbohydrate ABC transporter substrate-binding protein [Rhodophyticola sp. CCM32]